MGSIQITSQLQNQITRAVEALPQKHREKPTNSEVIASLEEGYLRIQDWAFTQGFAIVKESKKPSRQVFHCVHHKDTTRNTRKTDKEDRTRKNTHVTGKGYKFAMFISFHKQQGIWVIGYTNEEHNHDMATDPFQYIQHRAKRPGYPVAVAFATVI
jgi:hypothetical protein